MRRTRIQRGRDALVKLGVRHAELLSDHSLRAFDLLLRRVKVDMDMRIAEGWLQSDDAHVACIDAYAYLLDADGNRLAELNCYKLKDGRALMRGRAHDTGRMVALESGGERYAVGGVSSDAPIRMNTMFVDGGEIIHISCRWKA